MDAKQARERMTAAYTLLAEETTTREKFNHISTLLRGLNETIDRTLDQSHYALSTMDKIQEGDVISLSAEQLPETTDEEKRRKKMLLLFVKSWKDLKSEVVRVQTEMQNSQGQGGASQTSMWLKILKSAKGPLGVVTVVAIGIAIMSQTSVEVTIQNKGCGTLQVSGGIPLNIPGLKLPKDPIPNGGSSTLTIPPLALAVDGTQKGTLSLSALTFSFGFELGSGIKEIALDGTNLLGKKSEVHLSEKDSHMLVLRCQ